MRQSQQEEKNKNVARTASARDRERGGEIETNAVCSANLWKQYSRKGAQRIDRRGIKNGGVGEEERVESERNSRNDQAKSKGPVHPFPLQAEFKSW